MELDNFKYLICIGLFNLLKKILFIYLFLEGEDRKEKERERNFNVWLPLAHPLLGTWSATQACALTGNLTGDPLDQGPALNPLSHTCQGSLFNLNNGMRKVLLLTMFYILRNQVTKILFFAQGSAKVLIKDQ